MALPCFWLISGTCLVGLFRPDPLPRAWPGCLSSLALPCSSALAGLGRGQTDWGMGNLLGLAC